MIPIWYKTKSGRYITLTYFPDGTVGIPMEQAMEEKLVGGIGMGMGELDPKEFAYEGHRRCFLTRESYEKLKEQEK